VSQVRTLRRAQFGLLFFVRFLAFFLMVFGDSGFRHELFLVRFLFFAVFTFLAFVVFFFRLVVMVAVFFVLGDLVRFVQRLRLVLVELRAPGQCVCFRACLRLFVLRFHQASGEGNCLVVAQPCGSPTLRARWSFLSLKRRC
jgi:hypothetical protein